MIGRLLRGGFMTIIYAYLYIPIVILIVNSFNSSRFGINWQGFTTDWYSTLVNNDSLLQAAGHSLTMAILSATFATSFIPRKQPFHQTNNLETQLRHA